jgi:hypothetical protein
MEVALAEYAALRAEIDRRAGTQWSVFALQIGSSGAIGSLAISSRSNIGLLLLIPLSSYMLGTRYILHDFHIRVIHRYIGTSLSLRLSNDLGWEDWKMEALAQETDPSNWWTVAGWNPLHLRG